MRGWAVADLQQCAGCWLMRLLLAVLVMVAEHLMLNWSSVL